MPARRMSSSINVTPGTNPICWYPILLFTYSSGIAALAGGKYENLFHLLHAEVVDRNGTASPVILPLFEELSHVADEFKLLPGHERQYTPRSEYLFTLLQPKLDDLLFLGTDYESTFDQFEVLLALEYAHLKFKLNGSTWAPIGRFGWKHQRGAEYSPFNRLVSQAQNLETRWPALAAGFFDGSVTRFTEIAQAFSEQRLSRLGWY